MKGKQGCREEEQAKVLPFNVFGGFSMPHVNILTSYTLSCYYFPKTTTYSERIRFKTAPDVSLWNKRCNFSEVRLQFIFIITSFDVYYSKEGHRILNLT